MTQFDGVDCGSLHRGALSKASLISRGTEGSNPSPSSGESRANLNRAPPKSVPARTMSAQTMPMQISLARFLPLGESGASSVKGGSERA